MSALLALVATILTSFLPILNKGILRDARPALVAWVVNAASLPLLALGTLLLTQCSLTLASRGMPFSCTPHLPHVDGIFVAALLASVILNFTATLLSTYALAQADASLVSPCSPSIPPSRCSSPGLHSVRRQGLAKPLALALCFSGPTCSGWRKRERACWHPCTWCSTERERCSLSSRVLFGERRWSWRSSRLSI